MKLLQTDALIIGGGPSGLAAAVELKKRGVKRVCLIDRDRELGGVPRLCHNPSFGLVDLHRVCSGPAYARRRIAMARQCEVNLLTETTALSWSDDGHDVVVTSPQGMMLIRSTALLLATGCRERPRHARRIAGSRPAGVLTAGSLQHLVYDKGIQPGSHAVVVGAEHASFSAAETLRRSGCKTVTMINEYPSHQTYTPFRWWVGLRQVLSIHNSTRLIQIHGRGQVESVDCIHIPTGKPVQIPCDTVVFTGDWIPEHELVRLGQIPLNRDSLGPEVDQMLRTSRPGVFASGNLLHGAATAGVAALEGNHAARAMAQYLHDPFWPKSFIPVKLKGPLVWVSPNCLTAGGGDALPMNRVIFRVSQEMKFTRVELRQGKCILGARKFPFLVPNRHYSMKADIHNLQASGELELRVVQ